MTCRLDFAATSEYLTSIGCCRICVLRFLRPNIDEFLDIDEALGKKGLAASNRNDEPEPKRHKTNTCVACFGLFDFVDEVVGQVKNSEALAHYEVDRFVSTHSLPVSLDLAQLQIWLALLEKFPESIRADRAPDMPVKDVLKCLLNEKLTSELGKEFHPDGLMINVFFALDGELKMQESLEQVAPELMVERNKQRKKFRTEVVSRNYFEKHFVPANIRIEKFRERFPVPPAPPSKLLRLDKISFTGPTVFVAGRYNKFSRQLSQSPWVIGGKRMSQESVQEFIVGVVAPHFKAAEAHVTFMSSGREDVDVRCLGRGRPFVLEIMDAARTTLDESQAAEMERKVSECGVVAARDLQMIRRDELHHIKSGEEDKKKIYRALCTVESDVTAELLEKLQIEREFEIQQWTPLRVLHRRTLMRRPRTINSVRAHAVKGKPKVVVLDFVTQAGTYVKELVHGEFGRTEPSIASIIGMEIDIVALDVMNIDLNFPKSMNR